MTSTDKTSKKKQVSSDAKEKDTFKWTDDEAELKVMLEYKVSKTAERTDLESVQSKHLDIIQDARELPGYLQ